MINLIEYGVTDEYCSDTLKMFEPVEQEIQIEEVEHEVKKDSDNILTVGLIFAMMGWVLISAIFIA